MVTLQQHGLVLEDKEVTTELKDHVGLKQQNVELRYVISEMRREMEAMSCDVIKEVKPATIATKSIDKLWSCISGCISLGYIEFMGKGVGIVKGKESSVAR